MLKSSSWDYSDAYIFVKETMTVVRVGENAALTTTNRENKQVILKNCATFAVYFISEISNIQVDNVEDLDVAMAMYNLIE